MPNYEIDEGKNQITQLRQAIAEEKEHYAQLMNQMQEDKANFEENLRGRHMELQESYEHSIEMLHEKEKYNWAVVQDHMELKHVSELEERAK